MIRGCWRRVGLLFPTVDLLLHLGIRLRDAGDGVQTRDFSIMKLVKGLEPPVG